MRLPKNNVLLFDFALIITAYNNYLIAGANYVIKYNK